VVHSGSMQQNLIYIYTEAKVIAGEHQGVHYFLGGHAPQTPFEIEFASKAGIIIVISKSPSGAYSLIKSDLWWLLLLNLQKIVQQWKSAQ